MLTVEQKATNDDTWQHIHRVQQLLSRCILELMYRSEVHDESKLRSPEVEAFTEFTAYLASTTYGSAEYNEYKQAMQPAMEHHYAHNRHHPEHFKNGVADMNLIDLLEMLCDWKAASERHNDGNIRKSLEINCRRFDIGPQLLGILENTVADLEMDHA